MTLSLTAGHALESETEVPTETFAEPADQWSGFCGVWSELAEASDCSVFLSPLWVETWLEIYGDIVKTSLLRFESKGRPIGACLIAKGQMSWRRPLRRLSLNASGEPAEHTLYVEHNNLLCKEDRLDAATALADLLRKTPWDEFALDGFRPGRALDLLKWALSPCEIEERWQPCYYVDLAALRQAGTCYVDALGTAHRQYVRRKLRYQSQAGELRLSLASNIAEALGMLAELASLNSRRFEGRGRRGMWKSSRFTAFHRRFVEKGFADGRVQLLRVTAGSELVGVIYNLVHGNKVYFYQCGYRYSSDKRLSPGVVSLSLAVNHALAHGFDEFDFLAGDDSYKKWLSTNSRQLVWAVFRRKNARVWAYSRLRALKKRLLP